MDLWTREARLFKYGSGTGSNFSELRGENEPLSGGGKSSGLMSFLKIGDRAAGAIKSGGTTRRAAKMVCLDLDHPDVDGLHQLEGPRGAEGRRAGGGLAACGKRRLQAVMAACRPDELDADAHRRRSQAERGPPGGAPRGPRGHGARGLYPAGGAARGPGHHRAHLPRVRHRLGQRRLSHRRRPELQQQHPRAQRLLRRARARGRVGAAPAHRQASVQARARRASSGTRSPTRRGPARIPACSTTPPSTSGTPAPRTGASTPPIRA